MIGDAVRAPLLAALVPLAAACSSEMRNGEPGRVGEPGPDTIVGTVRVVGNEPFTQAVVEPEEGDPAVVGGPYRAEVSRLAGAVVRLSGRLGEPGYPGRTLEATSYEIVSVDGVRPLLGTLESDSAGFRLVFPEGGERELVAVSGPLAAREGALVWVVLDDRGGVARYGVLREPS